MNERTLDPDRQATLLLTVHFGGAGKQDPRPLGPTEWGDLARWLKESGHRPGELVDQRAEDLLAGWAHKKISSERLRFLLDRGSAMALALERWERAGIWILTRGDEHYPQRLKQRLGWSAPPVLFGCGNPRLLQQGGIAFTGSRNATDADLAFTSEAAGKIAAAGHSVISGCARGVDETAMLSALEAEGTVVGVAADKLLAATSSSKYRKALRSGNLVLISTYQPEARFSVGAAMGRNKYIYCLADAGIIITCEEGSGGTWAGAIEALKHQWVPVWTRQGPELPAGNSALLKAGARRLTNENLDPVRLMTPATPPSPCSESEQLEPMGKHASELDTTPSSPVASRAIDSGDEVPSPYEAFVIHLLKLLRSGAMPEASIKTHFALEKNQTKAWLKQAQNDGLIESIGKQPEKFALRTGGGRQMAIFS